MKTYLVYASADLLFDLQTPNPVQLRSAFPVSSSLHFGSSPRHPRSRAAQRPDRPALERVLESYGTRRQTYRINFHWCYSAWDRLLGHTRHHIARADEAACCACSHALVCWGREEVGKEGKNKLGKKNRSTRRRAGNILLKVTKFSDWVLQKFWG